jgi:hypothetical protein
MSRSSMRHASDALRVRPATAAGWLNNQRLALEVGVGLAAVSGD